MVVEIEIYRRNKTDIKHDPYPDWSNEWGLHYGRLPTFPTSNRNTDLWIDVRVTHALQRGKLRQTYKFCRGVFKAEALSGPERPLSGYLHKPTPAVMSSVKEKTVTYQGMLKIPSDQRDAGLRNHVSQVMPCVISHEGEFSEPLIQTIETLTTH